MARAVAEPPPDPKAWMSHSTIENGYIVRLSLNNGYSAFCPSE